MPIIPYPGSFPRTPELRDFLLTKRTLHLCVRVCVACLCAAVCLGLCGSVWLGVSAIVSVSVAWCRSHHLVLNAERGALHAPVFEAKMVRTRKQLLGDLANDVGYKQ